MLEKRPTFLSEIRKLTQKTKIWISQTPQSYWPLCYWKSSLVFAATKLIESLMNTPQLALTSKSLAVQSPRLWHNELIYKLFCVGTSRPLVRTIQKFLVNRKLQANTWSTFFAKRLLKAGVPQGSVFSSSLKRFPQGAAFPNSHPSSLPKPTNDQLYVESGIPPMT